MPFKSKAQRRKFAELLVKGEITEEAYERWNQETGKAKLPEYAHPKTRRKAKAKKKPKARRRPTSKAKARSGSQAKPTGKSNRKR